MMMKNSHLLVFALVSLVSVSESFTPVQTSSSLYSGRITLFSTEAQESETWTKTLSVSWEKPLGMVLEEVEEGAAKGVYVTELAEQGAAVEAPEKDYIVGSTLTTVMGEDVTGITFDDVMDKLLNSPSPVDLEFVLKEKDEEGVQNKEGFEVGTPVTVEVQVEGQPGKSIEAKVGDNLRAVLLENDVEVYRGFKAKVGNCGGGGQCGFCAVEFVESEGWEPRSDYEDKKIKNNPKARLSCLNNIQGPVTIKM